MAKSGNIQCHYDSSKNVHDISTVSVRYRYESMTIHDSMRINHSGTRNAHGACTVRYGISTIHGHGQLWSSMDDSKDNRTQFVVNLESSWCQRFHGFATELHDWLRSLTNSRKYSYHVSTNQHDNATVALRIRPHLITTTIRHKCFKQFKTSVALRWSFPNHHDPSRFTTVLIQITTVHHSTQ